MKSESIKLLLSKLPDEAARTLRSEIHSQDDMELIGEEPDPVHLLVLVGETSADVVVIEGSETGKDPPIVSHLLTEYPFLVVVAVDPRGSEASIYRLRTDCTQITLETKSALLQQVRNSCCQRDFLAGS